MKPRTKGAATGIKGRVPVLIGTLLAPIVIYLICRSAALGLSGPVAAAAGATLPPRTYSQQLKALVPGSQSPQVPLGPEVMRMVRSGSIAMPLAFEPFFIAAKAEERRGHLERARLLMEEAKRRRFNHIATRAHLVLYYGRAGHHAAFLKEVEYLLRRSETAKDRLVPEMVKLIPTPSAREALAAMLAKEPAWREQFFNQAAEGQVAPEDARALVTRIRAIKRNGDMKLENRFYVTALLSAGRYGAAKAAWLQTNGITERDQNLVFDGAFRGARAEPPFNWTFFDLDVGRASSVAQPLPHLEVEYFGGRDAVLAEQLLALAPGAYQLGFTAGSETGLKSGRLFWRVTCANGDRELSRLELRQLRPTPSNYSGAFTIPSSQCAGQKLQLLAEAGDVASPLTAFVSNLVIRRGS